MDQAEFTRKTIDFPTDLCKKLEALADEEERTFSWLIRQAAREYVASHSMQPAPTPLPSAATPAKREKAKAA